MLAAYSTFKLNGIRICTDAVSAGRCYQYILASTYSSAKELFKAGYIPATDINKKAFESLWSATSYSDRSRHTNCLQKPGFNIQCLDGNKARFGFCGNYNSQPCESDGGDADWALGIGIEGQFSPRQIGAGVTNEEPYNGNKAGPVQADVYAVYAPDEPKGPSTIGYQP